MRVFIQGMGGLGVEVAKNLILAGPKEVVIHD
jgi:molybdopterin/thiamine biosynthesis adenylyltransferase